MDRKRSALVLGGSGFIGGHIVKRLVERGWEVHALRRTSGSVGHIGEAPVQWHSGDLDRFETLHEPFRHAEILFHAAGYVPPNSRDVPSKVARSVQQTRNVCEAARRAGIERMVYTSTLTTIGAPPHDADRIADERDSYLPGSIAESAYYECKYAMESETLRYAAEGLPVVVVNPTFVLGPEDRAGTIQALMKLIAGGWGRVGINLEQNVVDVRDVAEGHVQAAERGRQAERYILGGTNMRVDALMSRIAEVLDAPTPKINLPTRGMRVLARAMNFGALGAVSNHLFGIEEWRALSTTKAEKELGYRNRSLEITLRDTINWYQERGILPQGETVV